MSDEIPTAFNTVNMGIKANDKGMLSESSHKCSPPLSTHDTRAHTHAHTHTSRLQMGPRKHQGVAAVCIHTALMPFGFLV